MFNERLISLVLLGPPECWLSYMATRVSMKHYCSDSKHSSITRRLVIFPGSNTSLLPEHCRVYTVGIKINKSLSHRCKSCRGKTRCTWNKDKVDAVLVVNLGEINYNREQRWVVLSGNTSSCTSMLWLKFLKASLHWKKSREEEINATKQQQYL